MLTLSVRQLCAGCGRLMGTVFLTYNTMVVQCTPHGWCAKSIEAAESVGWRHVRGG
jgi:hypothetical protein